MPLHHHEPLSLGPGERLVRGLPTNEVVILEHPDEKRAGHRLSILRKITQDRPHPLADPEAIPPHDTITILPPHQGGFSLSIREPLTQRKPRIAETPAS